MQHTFKFGEVFDADLSWQVAFVTQAFDFVFMRAIEDGKDVDEAIEQTLDEIRSFCSSNRFNPQFFEDLFFQVAGDVAETLTEIEGLDEAA